MKLGLRLQILMLLGGLLVCAFVPLFYAVATYTRVALRQARVEHARELGHAVLAQVTHLDHRNAGAELKQLLSPELAAAGLETLATFDTSGRVSEQAGRADWLESLRSRLQANPTATELELRTKQGVVLALVARDPTGHRTAILRLDHESVRAAPLLGLVALYSGVVALATLVLAYFALTRLIVRPLDELKRAASRVAEGGRSLKAPQRGAAELVELGQSLGTMTSALRAEEQALRRKIDEVERATEQLKEAQDSLVRSERLASVGRLAAGLAHEVGNPLAALMGLEDLLLEGGLSAGEQRDFLLRMRKETERIHNIVRDLLQFARPAHKDAAPEEPGDVATAIEETATLLRPQKSLQDVELRIEITDQLPKVALHTAEVVQIVLNLVLNAADACGSGGHIHLVAEKKPGGVRLSVADDGPGVAPSVVSDLFEPFVTTKEVGKGTGLGLAVCRGLVDSVGGSIQLDVAFENGARFVVDLPAA